jgi:hypothetical protein
MYYRRISCQVTEIFLLSPGDVSQPSKNVTDLNKVLSLF